MDQRPDYLFLVSEAMIYVVPRTRTCQPDRPSKTIFPEDVSENMTWMCLANPRIFCRVERLSSRLPTLLCRVDQGEPLMSNLFALPHSTIAGEPKYVEPSHNSVNHSCMLLVSNCDLRDKAIRAKPRRSSFLGPDFQSPSIQ